jgi:hypothetical protein
MFVQHPTTTKQASEQASEQGRDKTSNLMLNIQPSNFKYFAKQHYTTPMD